MPTAICTCRSPKPWTRWLRAYRPGRIRHAASTPRAAADAIFRAARTFPGFREKSGRMRSRRILSVCAAALAGASLAGAQYARPALTKGTGIDQKLNAPVPLDLIFHDETNQVVPLRT